MRLAAFMAWPAVLACISGPAAAQSMVEACQRAAALYLDVPDVRASNVQAFPQEPPRVRMTAVYVMEFDALASMVLRQLGKPTSAEAEAPFACSFTQAVKPFGLTKLCHSDNLGCVDQDRLEKLQAVLSQEGF